MTRSYLFVPADNERKLKKSAGCGADALILDLEDSVAASERQRGRSLIREFLADRGDLRVWVRINPLDTEDSLADLREVMPAAPDGIMLPKPTSARDVIKLGKLLDVFEQENNIPEGRTPILPLVTERPAALFHLHEYANATNRLAGLTWGAEDLSAAVGATANKDESGNWLAPYQLARSLCLFAAAAAEVAAIDTVYADFRNIDGLSRYAAHARRDGFSGMLAIHPAQVESINQAFTPNADELARAQQIVGLFEQNSETGVIGFDGKMLDRPHYIQAQRTIALARSQHPTTNTESK